MILGFPVGPFDLPLEGYVQVRDAKASGTAGGTSTSGSWLTRTLNAKDDPGGLSALESNQMTFSPGRYYVRGFTALHASGQSMGRLYDVTRGVTLLPGTSEYGGGGYEVKSVVRGIVTMVGGTRVEFQYRVGAGKATDGLGLAVSSGVDEVFSLIELWKFE